MVEWMDVKTLDDTASFGFKSFGRQLIMPSGVWSCCFLKTHSATNMQTEAKPVRWFSLQAALGQRPSKLVKGPLSRVLHGPTGPS